MYRVQKTNQNCPLPLPVGQTVVIKSQVLCFGLVFPSLLLLELWKKCIEGSHVQELLKAGQIYFGICYSVIIVSTASMLGGGT